MNRDIIYNILVWMTDTKSIAYMAMTCKSFNDIVVQSDIIRHIFMPVRYVHQVLHPSNLNYSIPKGFKFCVHCYICYAIIPVCIEAIVIHHKCNNDSNKFLIWTNQNVVLYRGNTSHLQQPIMLPDSFFHALK